MKDFYIIGGINGSGKTSISTRALELGADFNLVHAGRHFAQVMNSRGLNVNLDTIRLFESKDAYIDIQLEVFRNVLQESESLSRQKALVDSHYAMRMKFGYVEGFPKEVLGMLRPKALFLVEASPREIRSRRELDKTRRRGYDFEQDVEEMLQKEREYAQICSEHSGAPLHIVLNENGKLEKAAREFIKNLK